MIKPILINFRAQNKKVGLIAYFSISAVLFAIALIIPTTIYADLNDVPIGIKGEAEKASIARYLIGDYKFNDQTKDSTSSFIENIHSYSTLGFNGKNSTPNYIEIGNNSSPDKRYSFNKDFTMGVWARFEDTGSMQTLMAQGTQSPDLHDFHFYINQSNKLAFSVKNDSNDYLTYASSSSITIEKNEWYFLNITGKYNRDLAVPETKINFFINDTLVGTNTFPGYAIETPTDNSVFNIGSDVSMENSFRGYLDKAYIYNKSINASQIKMWYDSPARELPKILPLGSFDAFWELDEQSGSIAYDSSPKGRDGSLKYYNFSGWFRSNSNGNKIGSYGMQFDGIDDFIKIAPRTGVFAQSIGTIEIAFNVNNFPENNKQASLLSISSGQSPLYALNLYIKNDKKIYLNLVQNNISSLSYYYDNNLSLYKWYHLTLTYDSTNKHKLYINGIPATLVNYNSSDTWFHTINNDKIILGAFQNDQTITHFFSGSIQHIRNYPVSLTSESILKMYNIGYIRANEKLFYDNPLNSFDIDFNSYQQKFYTGTYTDTSAELKNIVIRAPPSSTDFTNPNFYKSQGIQFDSANDFLKVPTNASIRGLEKFSVGILFRYEGENLPSNKAYLYAEEKNEELDRFSLYINQNGQIECNIKYNSGTPVNRITADKYTDHLWHLAVCTFNSINNQVALYVDDIQPSIYTAPELDKIENISPNNIYIGSKDNSGANQFIGKINDVFIVKDVLNFNQIQYLNYSINNLVEILPSPGETYFAHYKFDEADEDIGPKKNSTHIIELGIPAINFNIDTYGDSLNPLFDWHNINESDLGMAEISQPDKLNFDGIDDYIEIDTKLNLPNYNFPNGKIALGAWVQTEKDEGHIISRIHGSDKSFELYLEGGKPALRLYSNSSSFTINSKHTINDNQIHSIFAQYDGNGQMEIYIDGEIANSTSVGQIPEIANLDVPITIGANDNLGTESFFQGSIANVKIYDTNLTASDINRIYLTQENLNKINLRLDMSLNEGAGNMVYDKTSSKSVGIMKNFDANRPWINPNNYLTFNTSNDYVNLPKGTIDIKNTDDFSLSFWIKPEGTSANTMTLIRNARINGTSFYGFEINLIPQTNQNEYKIVFTASTSSPTGEVKYTTNNINLSKSVWSNIIVKFYKTTISQSEIYVNGTPVNGTSMTATGNYYPGSTDTYIGINPDIPSSIFKGSISNLKIYDKNLTINEIQRLSSNLYTVLEADTSSLINFFNLDEGQGLLVQDSIDSEKFGDLSKNILWNNNNNSILNRKYQHNGSRALNINYNLTDKQYVNFGKVLTANENFAVEIVASANFANSITLLDYGFGDNASSGAKFKIEALQTGSVKLTISDGDENEVNTESYETSPETIVKGKFFTIAFLYDFSNNQIDLFVDNTLKIHTISNLSLNSENNHDMDLRIQGSSGELNYRSLKIATGESGNNSNILDTNLVLNAKMNEGNGNILFDSSGQSNHGNIYNGADFIFIPESTTNENQDITQKSLDNPFNYNAILDGKNSSIEIKHNKSLEFEKSDFAIEFWYSFNNPNGVYPLIEKGRSIIGDSSITNSFLLYMDNGVLKGWIAGSATELETSAIPLSPDTQYHFILQRRSGDTENLTLKVFHESSFVNYWKPKSIDSNLTNFNNINIGQRKDTVNFPTLNKYLTGQINEIRVLRRAYTADDLLNSVPTETDDLSLMIGVNTPLIDDIISRYSFNDKENSFLFDSKSQTNGDGEIKTDLVRFYNNGAKFNGENSYISISSDGVNKDNISLDNPEFSIETWVSLNNISKNQTILYKKSSGNSPNYEISYNTEQGFKFSVSDGSDLYSATSGIQNIKSNEPYHIVGIYKENQKIAIYLNGSLRSEQILPQSFYPTTSTSPLILGDDLSHNDNNNFDGEIYKLRMWKEAMSFDAITQHVIDPYKHSEELSRENLLIEYLFYEKNGETLHNSLKLEDLNGSVMPEGYSQYIWKENKLSGYFDGKNDYIEVTNDNRYNFNASEEFTIGAWVKTPGNPTQDYSAIISKDNPFNSKKGYGIAIEKEFGQVVFKAQSGSVGTSIILKSKSQITDNSWHHVAVTLDRDTNLDTFSLYIDSVLEDEIKVNTFDMTNDRKMTLGGIMNDNNIGSGYLRGMIDDIRLYSTSLNSSQIYLDYLEGPDNFNSISYSVIINNNSDEIITGDFSVTELLPPFFKISEDLSIFSAPNFENDAPIESGDLLTGKEYRFDYDLDKTQIKPGENIVLNFLGKIDEKYEDYSLEKTSKLKIVGESNSRYDINDPSFAKTITVSNPTGSTINGGNNIEQGGQAKIQILFANNNNSVYEDIIGEQNNSQIELIEGGSGTNTSSGEGGNYSPISEETATINPNQTNDVEYIKAYKRLSQHPSLSLEYLKPSNSLNKYFYSLIPSTYDLRIQWQLKDDPSSIDGYRWVQENITLNQTLADCYSNDNSCIGIKQLPNTDNFEADSWNNNNTNRKWKFQNFAESYTISGGGGDFGESYYFTYIKPKQGRNRFKIKIRDSLLQWGNPRDIEIWTDSYKPISSLTITGQNEKKKDPVPTTNWWLEGINSVLSIRDDVSQVSNNYADVSNIEDVNYRIYNIFQTPPSVWTNVKDNDQGQFGLKARWKFNEGSGQALNDETEQNDGTITYNAENEFWTSNGSGTFDGLENYVSFNGDILDLSKTLTIEAWINIDSNGANDGVLLSKWDNANNNAYKVEIGKDNEIHFFTSQNGSTITESNSLGANLTTGNYHLVIVKDGPFVNYYVDGVKIGTKNSVTEYIYNSNGNFYIGKDDSLNSVLFDGKINEIRIYQQTITDEVVLQHYQEGVDGSINSTADNNPLVGIINTEFNKNQDGIWKIDYQTQDKATPPNQTGIQNHTIKIDKTDPISSALESDYQNIQQGDNGWWKSLGTNGQGIMKVKFQVNEGVDSSSIFFGSGLRKLNVVHQVNDQGPEAFTIDWNLSTVLKGLLNFSASTSSGVSQYLSDVSSNPLTCTNGTYPINITEQNMSNVQVDVWIGGCTNSQLTKVELAKMVTDAINSNTNLTKFYLVTFDTISQKFKIESLGNRIIFNSTDFFYVNGTWKTDYLLSEDYGFTTSGKHRFYYWAEDIGGNIEPIGENNILTFKIDIISPPCPVPINPNTNAYAYKTNTGIPSTNRDNSLLNYVSNGYQISSILTEGLMDPYKRQGDKTPYFMWEKVIDQGQNPSQNIQYSYLWEKADDTDFNPNGTIRASQPNNLLDFSTYKAIGEFTIGNAESVLSAHRGALFPNSGIGGKDDIPEPEILNSDDGDTFFLWLRTKDGAGNINPCGQPGGGGVGPQYIYNYGTALKFITKELFDENYTPLELSANPLSPTKFATGPFIAGSLISFDKLYYNYSDVPTNPEIYETGAGSYETSQIVYLVNLTGEISQNDNFVVRAINDDEYKYPSVQISNSLNPFRNDITGEDWLYGYFEVDEDQSSLENTNDLYIGNGEAKIMTGNDLNIGNTPPATFNPNNYVGRFMNLGIIKGPRSISSFATQERGKVKISYNDGGNQIYDTIDTFQSPLSSFTLGDNPQIIRGFTNVSGRYKLKIALESSAGIFQYMQLEFDILPNEPNFDCYASGECADLKLKTP